MATEVTAFEAALSLCWALLAAAVLLNVATRDGTQANSGHFVRGGLLLMVVVQYFYLYQAAKTDIPLQRDSAV